MIDDVVPLKVDRVTSSGVMFSRMVKIMDQL